MPNEKVVPDSINDYIDSINLSIDTMRQNKEEITEADLPSDFKLMLGNDPGDSKLLQFIFDTKLDKIIDNLLNKMIMGDFSDIDKYSNNVKRIFDMLGIGADAFSGPVSQTLMQNIMNSLNSVNLNITQNKIKKVMLIIKNLKRQGKYIKNDDIKEKYLEAVRSLKQVLKFISKIYKNRRIISNRVRQGLNYAVNESFNIDEPLDIDFF